MLLSCQRTPQEDSAVLPLLAEKTGSVAITILLPSDFPFSVSSLVSSLVAMPAVLFILPSD